MDTITNIDNHSTTSRFSGASWANYIKNNLEISVLGLGGIGSWCSLLVSRLNPLRLRLYDFDTVDNSNISGQLYTRRQAQLKMSKTSSTTENIINLSNYYSIYSYGIVLPGFNRSVKPVTICGFDNMEARKLAYTEWKIFINSARYPGNYLFIDGRLSAEEFQIYCFTGADKDKMEKYEQECLFEDLEVEAAVCSYKQTSHIAAMLASYITSLVVNYSVNREENFEVRSLPYFVYFNGVSLDIKTEFK